MAFGRKSELDKLSVVELERVLRIKQREARKERFIRLSSAGATKSAALLAEDDGDTIAAAVAKTHPARVKTTRDRMLGFIEIAAVVALLAILGSSYFNLRTLNREMVSAQTAMVQATAAPVEPTVPAEAASLSASFLPGGHSSPTSEGGAVPDIPVHLQNWVQPAATSGTALEVPAQAVAGATRIVIPKINVDAPIIAGVTWDDLKKGVGHLPGSAQPGQRGNLYLAAHNDIFGEIFRYLDKLEPGDQYYIYASDTKYTYEVREKRFVDPTDVDVMLPTTGPVATLQSCWPYLIDTKRIVIISDLVS